MARTKGTRRKPSVKLKDLRAKRDAKGGRDAASGLPTGKRMHKDLVITKQVDKTTPTL